MRTRHTVRLGLFLNRFTMAFIDYPDGRPLTFDNYDRAEKFIQAHQLGKMVSPVEVTDDPDLDAMHIRHAVQEILHRLDPHHV